jgi:uncharacterized repeat protein (TIGR01451 family)
MWRNKKNIRRDLAVTEIVGCILMLGMATSSFSVVYYQVVSAPTPNPPPIVEISGAIDDNKVIVTHRGGEPLGLDTELVLNIGGTRKSFEVGDFLDSRSKEDGVWCLGERFVYPLYYDFDFSAYPDLDINIFDSDTSSLLMTGITKVNPTADVGVITIVDNLKPEEDEIVEFTITVTNYANVNVSGILIEFALPEGLTYVSSTMDQGSYDSGTGIWSVGKILVGQSLELIVKATVGDVTGTEPTQLVVILDGSESIEPVNWSLMKTGLSASVENGTMFPHTGDIELTVIQFGGMKPAFARLEIGPIVVTEANVDSVLEDIKDIDQIGDKTPTASGILMAGDVLKASDRFGPNMRQVVLLVTDGNPTHCAYPDGDYLDDQCSDVKGPKVSASDARDYLVNLLNLNEYDDEFNALSIEVTGDGHTYYLRDDVVWPQPGYETVDFSEKFTPNRGWVRNVKSWEDFAYSINESFKIIFRNIPVGANIKSTVFSDPKSVNDLSVIILEPTPKIAEKITEDDAIKI